MSYSPEYVEQVAAYRHREGCHTSGDMLDAYAATLRQQGARVGESDLDVLRRLRDALPTTGINGWPAGVGALNAAIDAHLTQSAQAVDVGAIREVIAELLDYNEADDAALKEWADKLTCALAGEKAEGWIPIEQFQCPEYEGDCPGYIYLYREGMEPCGGYRMQIGNGMWLANRGKECGVTHCMPLPTPPTDGEG